MRKSMLRLRSLGLLLVCTLLAQAVIAQNATIKGSVKSSKETLDGASVVIEGSGVGTHTNTNGSYELKIKAGTYTVTVSYVGYEKKTYSVTVTPGQIYTLDADLTKTEQLEKVTVVGSRSNVVRSSIQTAAPIDVFSAKDLQLTGEVEPTQMINYVAPSFNSSRQTIADGTDHIDPATLRGLGPDQVLVLVDGRRRYTTSLINVNGTIGRGSVGTDLNSIPVSAIEKIEVLRDGAASQYGSDAIAGVINVVLKKDRRKTNLNVHVGQYYAGDGLMRDFSANQGFALGKKGYIDLFGDVRLRAATNRVGDYTGLVYYKALTGTPTQAQKDSLTALDNAIIKQRGFSRSNNLLLGNSKLFNYNFAMDFGFPLSKNINLTGNAMFSNRSGDAAGLYRYPNQTSQVIAAIYPDGFLPHILSTIHDRSATLALDGLWKGWKWDLGSTYGGNSFQFTVDNSNNASQYTLGAAAPTTFNSGKLSFTQNTSNLNFTRDFGKSMNLKTFNVAFGGELRLENYQIIAGEEASYKNYDPTGSTVGGAQVFPGFQPSNAVNKNRTIGAGYIDIESDINDHLLFNVAGRYENYSDFGGNIAGKLSLRYRISDALSFRGTISNGFRAPSLQQRFFSNVSTIFDQSTSTFVQQGTFRNGSDIANSFGIPSLGAEKSVQYSLGVTSKPFKGENLTITADAYQIDIKDRIILTGGFNKTSSTIVAGLLSAYPDVTSAAFFTNAIKTSTQGLDVVLNDKVKIDRGVLDLTIAYNHNETKVKDIKTTPVLAPDPTLANGVLLNRTEQGRIEYAQPHDKLILGATFRISKFTLMGRGTWFGSVRDLNANSALDEYYSSKKVVDLSIGYRPVYWMNVTIGANNITDVYPDRIKNVANTSSGRIIYSRAATQFGFNGGYYYTNVAFDLGSIKKVEQPRPVPVAPIVEVKKPEPPKDTDGDGVPDKDDRCPSVAGLKSLGGCPDTDGDGIADIDDKCPTVAGIKAFDGCPDTDGDGIPDKDDKCPTQPGTAKYQGCPVPDTDGDGVNDDYDKCPTVPGTIANNGCPEDKKIAVQEKVTAKAKEILFETGSSKLKKSSYGALDAVATELKNDNTLSLDVEGYTDNTGSDRINLALSQKRADAVKKYLVAKGVAVDKIDAKGYGSSQPIADNKTAAGRAQNRRVVLKIK